MQIDEKLYNRMPAELQRLFYRLPNPGSEEVLKGFPQTKSGAKHGTYNGWGTDREIYGDVKPYLHHSEASEGSAARFFYCAKSSKAERNAGLEGMEAKVVGHNRFDKCGKCDGYLLQNKSRPSACNCENPQRQDNIIKGNTHPCVKPLSLMEYLARLTSTPTGGVVLDPFMGSGTTGMACKKINRDFIGIELDPHYFEIAEKRIVSVRQVELL